MADKISHFKRSHLIFLAIFFVCAIGAALWQYHWPTAVVRLGGQELRVMIAKTLAQQHKGLGARSTLAPYDGMLFLFGTPDKYGFVMRDMRFPIDIVWFLNGEVVDIAPDLQLEPGATEATFHRYYPRKDANTVLELPAGWAQGHGVKIGDRLEVVSQ